MIGNQALRALAFDLAPITLRALGLPIDDQHQLANVLLAQRFEAHGRRIGNEKDLCARIIDERLQGRPFVPDQPRRLAGRPIAPLEFRLLIYAAFVREHKRGASKREAIERVQKQFCLAAGAVKDAYENLLKSISDSTPKMSRADREALRKHLLAEAETLLNAQSTDDDTHHQERKIMWAF